jgi:hypothetical protein
MLSPPFADLIFIVEIILVVKGSGALVDRTVKAAEKKNSD